MHHHITTAILTPEGTSTTTTEPISQKVDAVNQFNAKVQSLEQADYALNNVALRANGTPQVVLTLAGSPFAKRALVQFESRQKASDCPDCRLLAVPS